MPNDTQERHSTIILLDVTGADLGIERPGAISWPLDYPPDAPMDPDERWLWLCSQWRKNNIIQFPGRKVK